MEYLRCRILQFYIAYEGKLIQLLTWRGLLGLQEGEALRISRQSAHEGGKVVSPKHWPLLPLRRYPSYSFLLEAGLTSGP